MNSSALPPPIAKSQERLREFDALRGFSMILVVFAHVLLGMGIGNTKTITGEIFITFRMPLFFFVSGFFAYRAYPYWTKAFYKRVFSQKIKAQIICTIVFFALSRFILDKNPFGWIYSGFQGYWFTIALFQMFTMYAVLNFIAHTIHKSIALPCAAVLALILMSLIPMHILGDSKIFEILTTSNVCYFFQFFVLGLLARCYEARFCKFISNNKIKAILMVGFVLGLCISHSGFITEGSLVSKLFSIVISYLGLLMLISLFYSARAYFNKSNFVSNSLCFTGRRTLDIYMLHYFFLPTLPTLGAWLAPNSMITFQLVVGLGLAVVITSICLLISNCLRSSTVLADWLFGVKRRVY